jgi:putative membrane protein
MDERGSGAGTSLTTASFLGTQVESKPQEIKMKRAMVSTLTSLLLAVPILAVAADKSPDESFFKHAAEGGIAEVEAGTLAQSKGSSQAVKDFGAMMVKDHSAANDKLKAIASAENVSLPTSSSVKQMASKAKLEVLTGDTFDKSYIKGQITAHQQTVALFKKEIASGTDAQAKAFATETLPTVRSHLKKIHQIAAEAGVTAK